MQAIKDLANSKLVAEKIRPGDGREHLAWSAPEPAQGRKLQRVTLNSLDLSHHPAVRQAVKMARAWDERLRNRHLDASLVLLGPNGIGKSHIARAIWWSRVSVAVDGMVPMAGTERPTGHFFMSNDLIGLMGNSRDPETGIVLPARAGRVIRNAPLVVIDDVGAEQTIPFVSAEMQEAERHTRFFKVVDYCYTAQISLIITSNLNVKQLANYLGRRSWDRIAQMAPRLPNGDSFVVDMSGVPSWRVKAGGR